MTIALESDVDTYLYLRSGDARAGTALHENDDHGTLVNTAACGNPTGLSSTDSCITVSSLAAGSYTIEATTYNPATAGSFTLTINGLGQAATVTSTNPSSIEAEEAGRFTPGGNGLGGTVSTEREPDRGGKNNVVEEWVAPQGALAFSASTVKLGDVLTITGAGFASYVPLQSVGIAGIGAPTGGRVFTDHEGNFSVDLTVPTVGEGNQTVEVIVGGETATGYLVIDSNAVANSPVPVGPAMAGLGSKLVVVWHYDSGTKAWRFYDPSLTDNSNLMEMVAGEVYLVQVGKATTASLNNRTRTLTCYQGNCWNIIVW